MIRMIDAEYEGYELVHYDPVGEHRIEHQDSGTCSTWLYYEEIDEIRARPASMDEYALDFNLEDG